MFSRIGGPEAVIILVGGAMQFLFMAAAAFVGAAAALTWHERRKARAR